MKQDTNKYINPETIKLFEDALCRGKDVIAVFDEETYRLIQRNSAAKASYEDLMMDGMRIAFNTDFGPMAEIFTHGVGTSSVKGAYSGSLPIRDFKSPVEELKREIDRVYSHIIDRMAEEAARPRRMTEMIL